MVRKQRVGNSQIFTCGGETRDSKPFLKKWISGLEIHCLDKPMTMNRRKKRKTVENCYL